MDSFLAVILRSTDLKKLVTNFRRSAFASREGKPIMVVGASISHPDSKAKQCHSVSAVVSSNGPDPIHYPGSVREQANFQSLNTDARIEIETHTGTESRTEKKHVQSRILSLESMMAERFRAWTMPFTRKPDVICNRQGLDKPSRDIITLEMTAIRKALFKVSTSAKKMKSSYIVVHKSDGRSSGPLW